MRCDKLFLWYLGDETPRYVGALNLVAAGKGVSLHYGPEWLSHGFPLSEDLPLNDVEFLPAGRLESKHPRAAGAVDDARPDRGQPRIGDDAAPQRLTADALHHEAFAQGVFGPQQQPDRRHRQGP